MVDPDHSTWSTAMTEHIRPASTSGPAAPSYGPPADPVDPSGAASGEPPAPRRRTGIVLGAVVAAIVVLGGLLGGVLLLFGTTTLDSAEAERQIARLTEEQAGLAPADVACPTGIEAMSGATFACTASLDGQLISFTARQTDDDGTVRIDSDNTFVDVAAVEASLAEQWGEAAGVEVVSTCDAAGHAVLVDGVGTPISCTVTNVEDASDSVEVTATVDETGAVSYAVV
jgi:hypothetical protein